MKERSARVLSCFSHVRLFATLWTAACQAPLSMGFSRQEYWRGLPFSTPGDLPNLEVEPACHMSPALAGRFFTPSATWEAPLKEVEVYQTSFRIVPVSLSQIISFIQISYAKLGKVVSVNGSFLICEMVFLWSTSYRLTEYFWRSGMMNVKFLAHDKYSKNRTYCCCYCDYYYYSCPLYWGEIGSTEG